MKNPKTLLPIFLLFAISIFSVSCDHGPVYEKYLKMKNSTWDRFDQKYFEIPVEDATNSFDITLVVRVTSKLAYDEIPFYVILTTPDGEERIREIKIPVRENGKIVGKQTGAAYETRVELWKDLSITAKGNCKISIENLIPKIQTEGIDEIGIVVEKSKQ
jgi:gliding motility-associated lipoprotein GldH